LTPLQRRPAYRVDVVDTTGAGDAFHGALTLLLAEGADIEVAIDMAMAAAALKCTRLGSRAGLPTREELEAFLASGPAVVG
jgi:sulfofructose kinase